MLNYFARTIDTECVEVYRLGFEMTGVNSERAMVVNSWKGLEWYPRACRWPPHLE